MLETILAALIAGLGSNDYRIRDACQWTLSRLPASQPAISAALKSNDPEIRRRADQICLAHVQRIESVLFSQFEKVPFLDSIPDAIQRDKMMHEYFPHDFEYEPELGAYRRGTRHMVRGLLLDGIPTAEIIKLLTIMDERTRQWEQGEGYKNDP